MHFNLGYGNEIIMRNTGQSKVRLWNKNVKDRLVEEVTNCEEKIRFHYRMVTDFGKNPQGNKWRRVIVIQKEEYK